MATLMVAAVVGMFMMLAVRPEGVQ
jgi:hypothetical protein